MRNLGLMYVIVKPKLLNYSITQLFSHSIIKKEATQLSNLFSFLIC